MCVWGRWEKIRATTTVIGEQGVNDSSSCGARVEAVVNKWRVCGSWFYIFCPRTRFLGLERRKIVSSALSFFFFSLPPSRSLLSFFVSLACTIYLVLHTSSKMVQRFQRQNVSRWLSVIKTWIACEFKMHVICSSIWRILNPLRHNVYNYVHSLWIFPKCFILWWLRRCNI